MKALALVVLCCLTTINAQAAKLAVIYQSDPPGAAIVQDDGQLLGYAPVTLYYEITKDNKQAGAMQLRGTSATWASGAKAEIPILRIDLRIGRNQVFTFRRPDSFPGRETDVQIALQMQQLALMRAQARADAIAGYLQRQQQIYTQMQQSIQQNANRRQTLSCTSNAIGNTVYTDCR